MMRVFAVLFLSASAAGAQSLGLPGEATAPLPDMSNEQVIDGSVSVQTLEINNSVQSLTGPRAAPVVHTREAQEAILRGLDKVSGAVTDLDLKVGQETRLGTLTVELDECRVPAGNPTGDAFAHLTIRADGMKDAAFDGWMIASSPALSALDHPRYDVWVIRCKAS